MYNNTIKQKAQQMLNCATCEMSCTMFIDAKVQNSSIFPYHAVFLDRTLKLFVALCDHNPPTLQHTDGQTDGRATSLITSTAS